jgi:excisionase family DNA binding protein
MDGPLTARAARARLGADLAAALRNGDSVAIVRAADRAKAMGVALAGLAGDVDVRPAELTLSTRSVATVLGYHPEHVRRLIRAGRLRATRASGDYRVTVDDLWALIDVRHHAPGRGSSRSSGTPDERAIPASRARP